MVHLLLIWLLSALSLMIAAYLLPTVEIESFGTAMIAAVVIGLLNATLGFLIRLVAFPLTWLLPGLMYLICDAIMIWIPSRLLRGFAVKNFTAAFLCALIVAVVNMLLSSLA